MVKQHVLTYAVESIPQEREVGDEVSTELEHSVRRGENSPREPEGEESDGQGAFPGIAFGTSSQSLYHPDVHEAG